MICVVVLFRVAIFCCFFFKQKTAYEMRISDWSSDVCSSDLRGRSRSASGAGPLAPLSRRAGASSPNRSPAMSVSAPPPLFLPAQADIGISDRLIDRIPLKGAAFAHRRRAMFGAEPGVAAIMRKLLGKAGNRSRRDAKIGTASCEEGGSYNR